MNAVFLCKLAMAYQSGLDQDAPEHPRLDAVMRRRAWEWWSQAIAEGMVLG